MFKFLLVCLFGCYLNAAEFNDWHKNCFKKLSIHDKCEVVKAINGRISFYQQHKKITRLVIDPKTTTFVLSSEKSASSLQKPKDDNDFEKMSVDARDSFSTLLLKIELAKLDSEKDNSKIFDAYSRSLILCNQILDEESARKTRDDDSKIDSMYDDMEVMV